MSDHPRDPRRPGSGSQPPRDTSGSIPPPPRVPPAGEPPQPLPSSGGASFLERILQRLRRAPEGAGDAAPATGAPEPPVGEGPAAPSVEPAVEEPARGYEPPAPPVSDEPATPATLDAADRAADVADPYPAPAFDRDPTETPAVPAAHSGPAATPADDRPAEPEHEAEVVAPFATDMASAADALRAWAGELKAIAARLDQTRGVGAEIGGVVTRQAAMLASVADAVIDAADELTMRAQLGENG